MKIDSMLVQVFIHCLKVERIVIAAVFLTFREDTQDENFIPTFILMIAIDFKDSESYSLSP